VPASRWPLLCYTTVHGLHARVNPGQLEILDSTFEGVLAVPGGKKKNWVIPTRTQKEALLITSTDTWLQERDGSARCDGAVGLHHFFFPGRGLHTCCCSEDRARRGEADQEGSRRYGTSIITTTRSRRQPYTCTAPRRSTQAHTGRGAIKQEVETSARQPPGAMYEDEGRRRSSTGSRKLPIDRCQDPGALPGQTAGRDDGRTQGGGITYWKAAPPPRGARNDGRQMTGDAAIAGAAQTSTDAATGRLEERNGEGRPGHRTGVQLCALAAPTAISIAHNCHTTPRMTPQLPSVKQGSRPITLGCRAACRGRRSSSVCFCSIN